MIICHVCNTECEDGTELCPVCGAELILEETEQSPKEDEIPVLIKNPVLAACVEDVVTAEIYRDILKENGIPFTCDTNGDGEALKVVFGGSFVAEDIYVDESNLERAQQLYEEVLNSEPVFDENDFDELWEDGADQGPSPDEEN